MSFYQTIVRNVLYPLDRWRTGDHAELRYLREFERSQYLAAADLADLRLGRLRRLVAHAYEQCPFYRRRFKAAGVTPDDIRSLDDAARIPILEKQEIQQHRDELTAENCPLGDRLLNQTGGSTGMPISFFVSRDRYRSRAAATWRHNRWAGWDIGDRSAWLWGAARDLPPPLLKQRIRRSLLERALALNTAQITENDLKDFHEKLKRFRPKVMLAYANSAVLLARYLKSHDLAAYSPHSIVTTAEVLEPADRRLLEEVFHCPVFNRYGCREVSVVASECAEHTGMHIMAEGLLVEVFCGTRAARPGESGTVLITDLLNFAMPLIRYRVGDVAVPAEGPCPCGRELPRLARVNGRVTDFLIGVDGRLVSGAALTVLIVAKCPTLGQVQIWQDRPGQVLYKIARQRPREITPSERAFLDTQTRLYLGETSTIDYQLVDELPCEPSGKYLFCRSTAVCDFLEAKAVSPEPSATHCLSPETPLQNGKPPATQL